MIHPSAIVQTSDIGKDTTIWQFVVILAGAKIGSNTNICSHCFIENKVVVGDNVTIKSGVQLWDGITIGDNAHIGPNVTFTNDLYPRSKKYSEEFTKIRVKEGASIGANATIITGVFIGDYAMVGAGSLVSKNVPPYTLWFGNPARLKGFVTKDGVVLNMNLQDKAGRQYVLKKEEPVLEKL